MTKLTHFSAPSKLDELSASGLDAWSSKLSDVFDVAAAGPEGDGTDSPRAQFYNPTGTDTDDDAQQKSIFWTAFPRLVSITSRTDAQRWQTADGDRMRQDEYCEWGVERNAAGKIVRVVFTSEVPEYFEALAADDPARLLALYRDLAGPEVELADLVDADGVYLRRNVWNATTDRAPVHLTQGNNTLGAAVELAAAATIVRVKDGRTLTSEQELIACSGYGAGERNSDPHIGAGVNELARQRADVTLADPASLYISDFTPAGWTTPDGTDPKSFWTYTRGDQGTRLRGTYEVPHEAGYTVGDIKAGGRPIKFGGQIADFVSIKLTGVACRFGRSAGEPFTVCKA